MFSGDVFRWCFLDCIYWFWLKTLDSTSPFCHFFEPNPQAVFLRVPWLTLAPFRLPFGSLLAPCCSFWIPFWSILNLDIKFLTFFTRVRKSVKQPQNNRTYPRQKKLHLAKGHVSNPAAGNSINSYASYIYIYIWIYIYIYIYREREW